MKNSVVLIRYVLLLWMLCGACHTLSKASASIQTPQYASWGYKPLHNMSNTTAETGTNSSFGGLAAKQTYQFQSTSVFIDPSRLGASYVREEALLRSSSWADPSEEDDPIVEYNPMPIGDTPWLWMLILAVAYIAIRRVRKRAHARVP